jgi:hypothetical protein
MRYGVGDAKSVLGAVGGTSPPNGRSRPILVAALAYLADDEDVLPSCLRGFAPRGLAAIQQVAAANNSATVSMARDTLRRPLRTNLEVSTGREIASAEVRLLARLRRSDPVGEGHHRQMYAGSAASSPRREKRARYPWINVVFLQSRKRF